MASAPYQHEWELKRTDLLGTWRELEPVIAACTRRIPDMKIAGYSLLSDAGDASAATLQKGLKQLPGNPTSISVKYEAPHSAVDEIELEVIAHQSYPTIHIDLIVRASLYAKAQELVELRFRSRYFGAGALFEYAKDRITREVARQELANSANPWAKRSLLLPIRQSQEPARRWYWSFDHRSLRQRRNLRGGSSCSRYPLVFAYDPTPRGHHRWFSYRRVGRRRNHRTD